MGMDTVDVSGSEVVVEELAVSVGTVDCVIEPDVLTDALDVPVDVPVCVPFDREPVVEAVEVTVPCVRELVITSVCVVEALVVMERESVVDIVVLSDGDRLSVVDPEVDDVLDSDSDSD